MTQFWLWNEKISLVNLFFWSPKKEDFQQGKDCKKARKDQKMEEKRDTSVLESWSLYLR